MATTLAIISDTHLRAPGRLPADAVDLLRAADRILHAGDWVDTGFVEELCALGPPVTGIHGNVDTAAVRARFPERCTLRVEDVRIGMVHDAGQRTGRLSRMRTAFPDCDLVVFGHSHLPLHEPGEDGRFAILNPGSPTQRRRAPRHTMAVVRVEGDRFAARIVPVGSRPQ